MLLNRVTKYDTSLSFLVSRGLVGEQSNNLEGFPSQENLDDIEPFEYMKEDPLDKDFDPIRVSLEKQWNKQNEVEQLNNTKNETNINS